jgi:Asp-tRNA(Asn)/Glu-tRNA(Gln) amidotransferase A subunit family amidase
VITLGKLFEEPVIIKIAYAYEQATQHRKPPPRFSALK